MSKIEHVLQETDALMTGVSATAQLRTPCGFKRAENIRVADLIVTRDHGLQPVRAIWTTTLTDAVNRSAENAAIKFAPRSIGPMMPRMSVTVAPDQAILLPAYLLATEVVGPAGLIPARALAGRSDAVFVDRMMDDALFYNFCFDSHVVLNVSGMSIESYRPSVRSMALIAAERREELCRRYPQLREKRDPFPPCAYDRVGPDAYAPGAL